VRTADFDFHLPPERIAQAPAEPRDSARLMVVRRAAGTIEHHVFRDLPGLLAAGDLLVVNDTRVMAARLRGRRAGTGGAAEALLVREMAPGQWETLFRPARHATPGARFVFIVAGEEREVRVVERDGATVVLDFGAPFDPARAGEVPLPPYIRGYEGDGERYQTVYAREARSAAAPTAGLHFTPGLLAELDQRGIERATLTLDVGPGTFVPVTADDPREHVMHAEHFAVPEAAAAAITAARERGGRVVAVGTTVVRTLEHSARENAGTVAQGDGWTSLKILPGDPFLAVDVMITNFHLPRSTLLMLVSAFAGRDLVLRAYEEAVAAEYRFYSFGDAMLVLP
jgi:S-adenosylmethionine:tRNA ribosyltransferase-isomerase